MKKRLFVIMLALIAMVSSVQAYVLYIGGTQVTENNMNSLSSISGVEQGTITFNGSTLTLTDVLIDVSGLSVNGITIGQSGITLKLVGTNRIISDYAALCVGATTTISGPGKLEAYSKKYGILVQQQIGGSLTIQNNARIDATGGERGIYDEYKSFDVYMKGAETEVEAEGMTGESFYNFRKFIFYNDLNVMKPRGAKISDGNIVYANGNVVRGERVRIATSNIAINETNFPDANFCAWVRENCQEDGNSYLTEEEIEKVKEIDVSNKGIASLKGIEYFTNLNLLNCSCNQLTELDISKLEKLEDLNCSHNQLTELNLHNLNILRFLNCSYNSLTSVDYNSLYMEIIVCYRNKIMVSMETIGLNDRTDLREFSSGIEHWPFEGSIYIIDSSDPLEENTYTDDFLDYAESNFWRVYDENGNRQILKGGNTRIAIDATNFPDPVFREYVKEKCDKNGDDYLSDEEIAAVTEINVSPNKVSYIIENLKGIEFFTALEYLDCSIQQLTSLDVSKNTALTKLDCSHNNLTSLDVSKNTALTVLDCSENQLASLDLSNNSMLIRLDCYRNQIKDAAMDALIASLPWRENKDGEFYAIYLTGDQEQNVVYTNQVAAAKANGWTTYYFSNKSWKEYEGSESPGVAINAINFPDPVFREYVEKNFDNGDGYLTDQEIAAVTAINVSYYNNDVSTHKYFTITTLKGIEYFTALTKLECHFCSLSSLDVSNNTALTYLDCSQNRNISSLDLSNNTALTYLDCSMNGLTWLGLSNNTALTHLNCFLNQLTWLDLSYNTALTYLDCGYNQLESFDLSNNTALTYLSCNAANLYEINLWNNTALTELYCSANPLTYIDLSNNSMLTEFACMNCLLTWLDVSQNTALEKLWCDQNQLTWLDVNNTSLNFLSCSRNQLSGLAMSDLIAALPETGGDFHAIAPDDGIEQNVVNIRQVAAAKQKHWTTYYFNSSVDEWWEYAGSELTGIAINATNFPDANFRAWVKENLQEDGDDLLTDEEIAFLWKIDVSDQNIADLTGIELFPGLQNLYCSNNQLTSLDVSHNENLRTLYCDNNNLQSIDVSNCPLLRYLSCNYIGLTSLDVSANIYLEGLDCVGNQLTSLDFSNNPMLRMLWCQNNQIQGTEMGNLVNSLPEVEGDPGEFCVMYYTNEHNVITTSQVAIAKGKNWKVKIRNSNGKTSDYEGVSDVATAISSVSGDATTDRPVYSLDGQRVSGKPTKKGVYVKDGRKVVVK